MIKDISKIPYLSAVDLGKAREHLHFRNGKQVKNKPQNKELEVFCTIEMRNGDRESLWMHRTEKLNAFFARLFQEHRSNQHIHFIEWEDRINCVVEDGIYISQTNFFMTKEEFAKFRATITPYEEEKPQPKHPCIGCAYFDACGSTTRTMPCKGRRVLVRT